MCLSKSGAFEIQFTKFSRFPSLVQFQVFHVKGPNSQARFLLCRYATQKKKNPDVRASTFPSKTSKFPTGSQVTHPGSKFSFHSRLSCQVGPVSDSVSEQRISRCSRKVPRQDFHRIVPTFHPSQEEWPSSQRFPEKVQVVKSNFQGWFVSMLGSRVSNHVSSVKFSQGMASRERFPLRKKDHGAEGFAELCSPMGPTFRQSSQTRSLKFPMFPTKLLRSQ